MKAVERTGRLIVILIFLMFVSMIFGLIGFWFGGGDAFGALLELRDILGLGAFQVIVIALLVIIASTIFELQDGNISSNAE